MATYTVLIKKKNGAIWDNILPISTAENILVDGDLSVSDFQKKNSVTVSPYSQFKTINSAIDFAKEKGVSKTNRFTINVSGGVYNERIVMAHGIDIVGSGSDNTVVTYSGTGFRTGDTVVAPYDCSFSNLKIVQDASLSVSELQNYAVHIDENNGAFTVTFNNVVIHSIGEWCSQGMGIGLYGAENVKINNCTIISDSKAGLYLHNWNNQTTGVSLECVNTSIYGCVVRDKNGTGKNAVLLEDLGSGHLDSVVFKGCKFFSDNNIDIKLQKHTDFSGVRNTLFCGLEGCQVGKVSYEEDSGTIVNLDNGFFVTGAPVGSRGNPLEINGTSSLGNVVDAKVSDGANSDRVIGIGVPYLGKLFCATKGVVEGIIDASATPVVVGDLLASTATGGLQKATISGSPCAIALESVPSGFKNIKVLCYK